MPSMLTEEEKKFFEDCMELFISNEVIVNPQRHYKVKKITDLKNFNSTVNFPEPEVEESEIKKSLVELPRDIELVTKSIQMAMVCEYNLDAIHQKIRSNLLNKITADLDSTDKLGELIIVPDSWQEDPEICAGIIMRDKAHRQRNGHAIILTLSELDLLIENGLINHLPLQNIYKISTLMHSLDFKPDLYEKINTLITHCCSTESCHLREITLRQCSAAGDRPAIEPERSLAKVPDSTIPSETEIEIVENIIRHSTTYTEEELQTLKTTFPEIQTRPAHSLEAGHFVDLERPLAILSTIIQENALARYKIPHLLIKGYYGPVSPSPEGTEAVFMRPARQQAASNLILPPRFFKATRVAPFQAETEQSIEDHQPRKGGRRNP